MLIILNNGKMHELYYTIYFKIGCILKKNLPWDSNPNYPAYKRRALPIRP